MALTKHYKKLLSSADINVFYCGSAEFTRVKDALLDAFSSISRTGENNVIYTDIVLYPKRKEPVISREYMDVSQAKLAMGFRMGDAMISPNYPALNVFNSVYGGCLTSKLFLNVRERLSLAYYASSAIDQHKGIMRVLSGIEESNFNKAYDEILLQLDDIKAGNISDEELTGAKLAVITSLKSSCDSLFSLENLYYDLMLSGIELSPEDLSVLAAAVTKEELVKIAAGIKLDTTYLLSGNRG